MTMFLTIFRTSKFEVWKCSNAILNPLTVLRNLNNYIEYFIWNCRCLVQEICFSILSSYAKRLKHTQLWNSDVTALSHDSFMLPSGESWSKLMHPFNKMNLLWKTTLKLSKIVLGKLEITTMILRVGVWKATHIHRCSYYFDVIKF